MRHDRRPVKTQVKSGLLIGGKLVAAFCIAAVFLSGCGLVQEAASLSEIVIGWLLITLSIVLMAFTVRFWAAGFFGFIAYAALRLLGGTLFAKSPLHMLSVAASLFAMSILCIRFASGKPRVTRIDRASLVLAAIGALLSLPLMDSYRSVVVLNVANVALVLSFTENRSHVPVQHALVILEGFRAYSRSYGCLKPSVKVFVQRYLGPFQIAAQVTLSQFSC